MTAPAAPEPEPDPTPHPETPPALTGGAKVIDELFRNDGRFFAAMAALVIFLTLVYHV